jgi:hypothetical protein
MRVVWTKHFECGRCSTKFRRLWSCGCNSPNPKQMYVKYHTYLFGLIRIKVEEVDSLTYIMKYKTR